MSEETKDQKELQQERDDALKATFPASDPASIGDASGLQPDRPMHRKPATLDVRLARELARKVADKHR